MNKRRDQTRGEQRRSHEADEVPSVAPGPYPLDVGAPTRHGTHGAGARLVDARHVAVLVRCSDTGAIAVRTCEVTQAEGVHPNGAAVTDMGSSLETPDATGWRPTEYEGTTQRRGPGR